MYVCWRFIYANLGVAACGARGARARTRSLIPLLLAPTRARWGERAFRQPEPTRRGTICLSAMSLVYLASCRLRLMPSVCPAQSVQRMFALLLPRVYLNRSEKARGFSEAAVGGSSKPNVFPRLRRRCCRRFGRDHCAQSTEVVFARVLTIHSRAWAISNMETFCVQPALRRNH